MMMMNVVGVGVMVGMMVDMFDYDDDDNDGGGGGGKDASDLWGPFCRLCQAVKDR